MDNLKLYKNKAKRALVKMLIFSLPFSGGASVIHLEQVCAANRKLEEIEEEINQTKERIAVLEEQKNKGTVGFFESLEDITSDISVSRLKNATYAKYTNFGAPGDATDLEMMKKTFVYMRQANEIRAENGLPELLVTSPMMAVAQSNVNAASVLYYHSYQYTAAENLSFFYQNPFDGWYYEEKRIVDYVAEHPGSTQQEIADGLQIHPDEVKVNHYYNLMDPEARATGFGYRKDKYGRVIYCQVFQRSVTLQNPRTVDEYESVFLNYCDGLENDLQTMNDKLAELKKEYNRVKNPSLSSVSSTSKISLNGCSLSLSGDITLNLFMNIAESVLADKDAYIEVNLPNSQKEKYTISELEQQEDSFVIPCHVSAKDMTGNILVKVFSNSTAVFQKSYSIQQYAKAILDNPDKYDDKTINIVKSMLTYGYYAQIYFDHNTSNLPQYINPLKNYDLSAYKARFNPSSNSKIASNFIGGSLFLKSKPGIKLVFSEDGEFKVDGKPVRAEYTGKNYTICINDIDDFSKLYKITYNGDEMEYGIFSYGNIALTSSTNQKLKNLILALKDFSTYFD